MIRWAQALGVVVTASLLAACGSGASSTTATTEPGAVSSSPQQGHLPPPMYPVPPRPTQSTSSPATPSPHPSSPQPSADATPAAVPPTKVLVFLVENHTLDEMRAQMPWTAALADRYGYATTYHAMTHPSLPNYLAIAGGSTFGVQTTPTRAATRSAARRCSGARSGRQHRPPVRRGDARHVRDHAGGGVRRKHNPWAYFVDERADCDRYDVPLDDLAPDARAGTLPGAGMVIADMCHIAHDCPLATADAWLKTEVAPVLAGPDFRQGRLVVVITADEDDHSGDNRVLTVVASTDMPAPPGRRHPAHPSLPESPLRRGAALRTAARGGRDAPSLADAFHLGLTGA